MYLCGLQVIYLQYQGCSKPIERNVINYFVHRGHKNTDKHRKNIIEYEDSCAMNYDLIDRFNQIFFNDPTVQHSHNEIGSLFHIQTVCAVKEFLFIFVVLAGVI